MGVGQDLNLIRLSASPTSLPLDQGQNRKLPVHLFLNHKKTGQKNPTTHFLNLMKPPGQHLHQQVVQKHIQLTKEHTIFHNTSQGQGETPSLSLTFIVHQNQDQGQNLPVGPKFNSIDQIIQLHNQSRGNFQTLSVSLL